MKTTKIKLTKEMLNDIFLTSTLDDVSIDDINSISDDMFEMSLSGDGLPNITDQEKITFKYTRSGGTNDLQLELVVE